MTAKTFGAARATPELLEKDPDAVVVNTAHSNMAMYKMVKDTIRDEKALVLLSGYVKKEFGKRFKPYRKELLITTVKELFARLELPSNDPGILYGNKKFFQRYLNHCEHHPRYANETKTLTRVLTIPLNTASNRRTLKALGPSLVPQ